MTRATVLIFFGIVIGALSASLFWSPRVTQARAAMNRALQIAKESMKNFEQEEREYVEIKLDSLLRLPIDERERYLLDGLFSDSTGHGFNMHDSTGSGD